MTTSPDHQVFLLSPAFCGGRRAGYLLRPQSTMQLSIKLAAGALTLGEAFSFMSGLYFRGKLGYAKHFGRHDTPVHVITPTRGLMCPDAIVNAALLREFAEVDVDGADVRYRAPLDRSIRSLATTLENSARVVLLGSIATGKYVDALSAVLGAQLHFPSAFVGRGDMSRGGLLLRCIASGVELEYRALVAQTIRHGTRPPKLAPIARTL